MSQGGLIPIRHHLVLRACWLAVAALGCAGILGGLGGTAVAEEPAPPTRADPIGEWYVLTAFRGEEMTARLTITRSAEGSLAGSYVDAMGGTSALLGVSCEAGSLRFTRTAGARTIGFRGNIAGDVLTGHHLLGSQRIPFEGRRGKKAFDEFVAAYRLANVRSTDLEKDYDKHAHRVVPRDAFPVLFDPPMRPAAQATGILEDEPVIGIAIGGEAKAYPISIMGIHELVNDTCGGTAIAASW